MIYLIIPGSSRSLHITEDDGIFLIILDPHAIAPIRRQRLWRAWQDDMKDSSEDDVGIIAKDMADTAQ